MVAKTETKTLKELLAEFDAIVDRFDNDDLDVEKALSQFEKGSKLADEIKAQLKAAKNKIELVKRKFDTE